MARLPQVGSDDGSWGNILNDFLLQSHTASGTLQAGSVGSTQLQNGSIDGSKLSPSLLTQLQGTDGASAYDIAVQHGFIGSETAWLNSLKGANGATGPQGEPGADGATGPQGPKGDAGAQGDIGETGAQGPKGDDGTTGPQGPKGDDGAPGAQGPKGDAGAQGDTGPKGDAGEQGEPGPGVIAGGLAGQLLMKNSSTDYDTAWTVPPIATVTVVTGSEPRPVATSVFWLGASEQPVNMAIGDVWMKES